MAVRTKEFGSLSVTTAQSTPVALYTCPAGKTAIVKEFCATPAGSITITWQVVRGALVVTVASGAGTASAPVVSSGRYVVLEPGDVLQVKASSNTSYTAAAYGTELDGVAA